MDINFLLSLIRCNSADEMLCKMYEATPEFKKFLEDNEGLSPQEIAQKNGIVRG